MELLFTIVVIALVFTVIPRVLSVTNQSFDLALKEDGIYHMMSKAMDIAMLEFDESNLLFNDILLVQDTSDPLECNSTTHLRKGGFYGGRDCMNEQNVTPRGTDAGESSTLLYDDVDDYHDVVSVATKNGNTKYKLYSFVGYSDDAFSYDYVNAHATFSFTNTSGDTFSHIKRIYLKLEYTLKGEDKNISSLSYFSANIGHTFIESREW